MNYRVSQRGSSPGGAFARFPRVPKYGGPKNPRHIRGITRKLPPKRSHPLPHLLPHSRESPRDGRERRRGDGLFPGRRPSPPETSASHPLPHSRELFLPLFPKLRNPSLRPPTNVAVPRLPVLRSEVLELRLVGLVRILEGIEPEGQESITRSSSSSPPAMRLLRSISSVDAFRSSPSVPGATRRPPGTAEAILVEPRVSELPPDEDLLRLPLSVSMASLPATIWQRRHLHLVRRTRPRRTRPVPRPLMPSFAGSVLDLGAMAMVTSG
jgi:hypothetical protein